MDQNFWPKIPETTIVLKNSDDYVFLIPEKPDWIHTNGNVASLLLACDEKKTLQEILDTYKEHPNFNEAKDLIEKLIENNFFDNTSNTEKHIKPSSLYSLHLNMTNLCNLKCIYCYAKERDNTSKDILTLDELTR
ncbi:MAG: hypothetical protein IJU76_08295 [Desulfovibrionaceae bacterium]|nr:hypothetical protein [Desulfovibrionaceae bacterium]